MTILSISSGCVYKTFVFADHEFEAVSAVKLFQLQTTGYIKKKVIELWSALARSLYNL